MRLELYQKNMYNKRVMKSMHKAYLTVLTVCTGVFILQAPVSAAVFDRNRIIEDADMVDYNRMSVTAIQSFLAGQGGNLDEYRATDVDGVNRSAAEILYRAGQRYRLNPQFILSHLQKESSLVTRYNANLIEWAMGYGVCDSCSKDDPNVIKYKGFSKQIDAAANQFRNVYLRDLETKNSTISGWGVNVPKNTLDGVVIIPRNRATAALYTYTPWLGYNGGNTSVGGNSLFFDIMERFFPNRGGKIVDYPNFTLLQDRYSGKVYQVSNHSSIRPITSRAALLANYDPSRIVVVDDSVLSRYTLGADISYPRFILLQAPSGGIYMIDKDHKKRAITSREIFHSLGYNPEEVISVSQSEIDAIPENPPITTADKYPLGAVIQIKETGALEYMDARSNLHPIWAKEIFNNQFKGYAISSESQKNLEAYKQTSPVRFKDGTLLKARKQDQVYVIDKTRRRPVNSKYVLNRLGGFEDVVITSKSILKLHDKGKEFTFKKVKVKAKSQKESTKVTTASEKKSVKEVKESDKPKIKKEKKQLKKDKHTDKKVKSSHHKKK